MLNPATENLMKYPPPSGLTLLKFAYLKWLWTHGSPLIPYSFTITIGHFGSKAFIGIIVIIIANMTTLVNKTSCWAIYRGPIDHYPLILIILTMSLYLSSFETEMYVFTASGNNWHSNNILEVHSRKLIRKPMYIWHNKIKVTFDKAFFILSHKVEDSLHIDLYALKNYNYIGMIKRQGPRTEPCGTPVVIFSKVELYTG